MAFGCWQVAAQNRETAAYPLLFARLCAPGSFPVIQDASLVDQAPGEDQDETTVLDGGARCEAGTRVVPREQKRLSSLR